MAIAIAPRSDQLSNQRFCGTGLKVRVPCHQSLMMSSAASADLESGKMNDGAAETQDEADARTIPGQLESPARVDGEETPQTQRTLRSERGELSENKPTVDAIDASEDAEPLSKLVPMKPMPKNQKLLTNFFTVGTSPILCVEQPEQTSIAPHESAEEEEGKGTPQEDVIDTAHDTSKGNGTEAAPKPKAKSGRRNGGGAKAKGKGEGKAKSTGEGGAKARANGAQKRKVESAVAMPNAEPNQSSRGRKPKAEDAASIDPRSPEPASNAAALQDVAAASSGPLPASIPEGGNEAAAAALIESLKAKLQEAEKRAAEAVAKSAPGATLPANASALLGPSASAAPAAVVTGVTLSAVIM